MFHFLCWFYQVLAVGVCEAVYTLCSSLCWFYQVLAVGVAGVGTAPVSNETLRRVASPPQAINKDYWLSADFTGLTSILNGVIGEACNTGQTTSYISLYIRHIYSDLLFNKILILNCPISLLPFVMLYQAEHVIHQLKNSLSLITDHIFRKKINYIKNCEPLKHLFCIILHGIFMAYLLLCVIFHLQVMCSCNIDISIYLCHLIYFVLLQVHVYVFF